MERLQIPSRAHAQLPHVQDLTSTLAIHEQDFYLFFFFVFAVFVFGNKDVDCSDKKRTGCTLRTARVF